MPENGQIAMSGSVANFILIPQTVRCLDIPVIAGGGRADGRGFSGALAMGAEVVLLGTAQGRDHALTIFKGLEVHHG